MMQMFRCNSVANIPGKVSPNYERKGFWWETPFTRCLGGEVIADPQLPVDFCSRCGGAVGPTRGAQ